MTHFVKAQVPVTLTGEEWTAILAALLRKKLSDKGRRVYREAMRKMTQQIGAASDVYEPPLCSCCGVNLADLPSKICVGCHAYEEHTA